MMYYKRNDVGGHNIYEGTWGERYEAKRLGRVWGVITFRQGRAA
jgi:hypothetical protein